MRKAHTMSLNSFSHPNPFLPQPIFPQPKFFKLIDANTSIVKASSRNANSAAQEIRVCTNRTCRRQGSLEFFQILSGIAPPYISVNSCGCLGRCGAGPNVVVLPDGVFIGHCGTPSKAAHLMISFVDGFDYDENDDVRIKKCLEALALRKTAEDQMAKGEFEEAQNLLSQAIDLKPFGGVHIMYKSRSAARLAMGNNLEALEDAKQALSLAPNYPEGYICQGDALMAIGQFDAAEKYYSMALDLDPSLRRSKAFKARIAVLQEKLAPVNLA